MKCHRWFAVAILSVTLVVALVSQPAVAHPASSVRTINDCVKRYTVNMDKRAARVIWDHTPWPSAHELHVLGNLVHCQRNPAAEWYCRWYNHHQQLLHKERAAIAQQENSVTPYGEWAIPSAIVYCESRYRNLPPNSAGASGYYQIIVSTWYAYGGARFGPAAYESSKYGQDVIASRIWDHGNGASQWVCKA